jgi:hypothetical protein
MIHHALQLKDITFKRDRQLARQALPAKLSSSQFSSGHCFSLVV